MKWTVQSRRFGAVLLCVTMLTTLAGIVGNAAVTFTTPNSATVSYSLSAGATTSGITPATNQPVLLIGVNTGVTNFSVSTATLVHIPSTMIRWVGLESAPSGVVVHGGTTTPGTHIVYLDYSHKVDVEVLSADQFVIHNGSTATQAGSVKLIW